MRVDKIRLVHRDTLSVESILRRAPDGTLICTCTCGDIKEPAPQNRICLFRSCDGGEKWEEQGPVTPENGYAYYMTETAVLNNKIYLFAIRHDGNFTNWENLLYCSEDSGRSWNKTSLKTCFPALTFVRGMAVLSNGNILFPYHAYPITAEQNSACSLSKRLVTCCDIDAVENGIIYSDDGGKTFRKKIAFIQKISDLLKMGFMKWTWSENTVVELDPGHLVMLLRLDASGVLWKSESFDYGVSWNGYHRTDIPNPGNKPQLLKRNDGMVLLLNTPRSGKRMEDRFPLEVWCSMDGMRSWVEKLQVSDFPGAYSYANGFIDADDRLKFSFEFNRHDIYYVEVEL